MSGIILKIPEIVTDPTGLPKLPLKYRGISPPAIPAWGHWWFDDEDTFADISGNGRDIVDTDSVATANANSVSIARSTVAGGGLDTGFAIPSDGDCTVMIAAIFTGSVTFWGAHAGDDGYAICGNNSDFFTARPDLVNQSLGGAGAAISDNPYGFLVSLETPTLQRYHAPDTLEIATRTNTTTLSGNPTVKLNAFTPGLNYSGSNREFYECVIWDRALTAAEMASEWELMRQRLDARGITLAT